MADFERIFKSIKESDLNGGTFSNFDLLSDYEKPTVSGTLKNIKKRLVGR